MWTARRVRPSTRFSAVTTEVIEVGVFTAVLLVVRGFRDVALCGVVNSNGRFEGPWCLQGQAVVRSVLELLCPEDAGTTVLRNLCNSLPVSVTELPNSFEYS